MQKKIMVKVLLLPTIIFYLSFVAKAQDERQPQAKLRVTFECRASNCSDYQPPDDKFYSVEILMPLSIKLSEYNKIKNNLPEASKVAELFYKKTLRNYRVQISPKDNLLPENNRRRFFVIYLPKDFDVSKDYRLKFSDYPAEEEPVSFLSATVGTDHSVNFGLNSYNNIFQQRIIFESKPIACDESEKECNEDSSALLENYEEYKYWRLANLNSWFNALKPAQVELRVEDETRCLGENNKDCLRYGGKIFDECYKRSQAAADPPKALIECAEEYYKNNNLKPEELAVFSIADITTARRRILPFDSIDRVVIDIKPSKKLPGKFNSVLSFNAQNVPFEVVKPAKSFADEIKRIEADPAKESGKVGERDLDSKLDVGFLFGSSVEQVEKEVGGVKVKVKERKTQGVLDLWVKPFDTKNIILPVEGEKSKGWYLNWTPAFLDAKVSTGKITKDTLSVNRVVFGTQFDNYYYFANNTNPTYLRFIGRLLNASDRDFRQSEYKVNMEFQPTLSFLNHIPANFSSTRRRVLRKSPTDNPLVEIPDTRGYEFTPMFGGELGKTWLRRNPAEAIKPGDAVKRFYVGLDTKLYLSRNFSLSLFDRYYINFGTREKKRVNYFKGSLNFRLRGTQEFGDSVFISFERGNQPPFNTPDVNAFKVGYRFVNPRINFFR